MQAQQQEEIPHDGYELFRRAIVERDEQAWAESIARYRPLMIAWANQYRASRPITEQSDELADMALTRAWMALAPERFAAFPNLAALLAYLRTCVATTVIDCARTQVARERACLKLDADAAVQPEQIVMAKLERAELWLTVSRLTRTALERTILIESFVYGLSPRAILERHPDLFANIGAVYGAKRNLLNRLQRSPELRKLHAEWITD